jgi:hypothetical protein
VSWHTTVAVDEFLAEAGAFVRADPVQNTVILTMAERLRVRPVRGRASVGDTTLFGWWRPTRPAAGQDLVSAAFMHTPGFPVVPTAMTDRAAAELAGKLAASALCTRRPPGADMATRPARPRR